MAQERNIQARRPCISRASPLHLPYISPASPLHLPCIFPASFPASPLYLRCISPHLLQARQNARRTQQQETARHNLEAIRAKEAAKAQQRQSELAHDRRRARPLP